MGLISLAKMVPQRGLLLIILNFHSLMLSKITLNMHIHCRKIIDYKKERRKKSSETSPLKDNCRVLLYTLLDCMCVCVRFLIDICSMTKIGYNYT